MHIHFKINFKCHVKIWWPRDRNARPQCLTYPLLSHAQQSSKDSDWKPQIEEQCFSSRLLLMSQGPDGRSSKNKLLFPCKRHAENPNRRINPARRIGSLFCSIWWYFTFLNYLSFLTDSLEITPTTILIFWIILILTFKRTRYLSAKNIIPALLPSRDSFKDQMGAFPGYPQHFSKIRRGKHLYLCTVKCFDTQELIMKS